MGLLSGSGKRRDSSLRFFRQYLLVKTPTVFLEVLGERVHEADVVKIDRHGLTTDMMCFVVTP